MAVHYTCDCCREVIYDHPDILKVPKHIVQMCESGIGQYSKMVRREHSGDEIAYTSGASKNFHLCGVCENKINVAQYRTFLQLQKEAVL